MLQFLWDFGCFLNRVTCIHEEREFQLKICRIHFPKRFVWHIWSRFRLSDPYCRSSWGGCCVRRGAVWVWAGTSGNLEATTWGSPSAQHVRCGRQWKHPSTVTKSSSCLEILPKLLCGPFLIFFTFQTSNWVLAQKRLFTHFCVSQWTFNHALEHSKMATCISHLPKYTVVAT